MKKTLSTYLWWTENRGSFHYDVMVTLILLFIFVTPHLWDYHDRPSLEGVGGRQVLVKSESPGNFTYQINAAQIDRTGDLRAALQREIATISGNVVLDKYEVEHDSSNKVVGYKVWAHR